MTTTTEPTPEQILYRSLLACFKQDIKNDAISIRTEKRELRALASLTQNGESSAVLQSRLQVHRLQARARLLIYGTLRGRTWDQMENRHAEKNGNLAYWITKVWNAAQTSVPKPAQLEAFQ